MDELPIDPVIPDVQRDYPDWTWFGNYRELRGFRGDVRIMVGDLWDEIIHDDPTAVSWRVLVGGAVVASGVEVARG